MNGTVARWLSAYTCSVTGDSVYFVTLSWAASRGFGPTGAGAVLAVGAVPRAVLMLGGGVVADRYGPWRVVIGSDLVRCVLVVGVGTALAVFGRVGLWPLMVLAAGFGSVDALFMPAVGALPPVLVAAEQLARVQSMRVLAVRAGNLVGPVLAGVALGVGGAAGAFSAAGMLFAVSLAMLVTLRIPRAAVAPEPVAGQSLRDQTLWQQFTEGLRYVKREAELRRLVIVIGLSELCFSGPIAVAVVMLAGERGWSSGTVGWILGAFSVGGAVIAGAMAVCAERIARGRRTLPGSLAATTALLLGWGATGRLGAVVVAACLGVASGVTMVVANARLQVATTPHHLGRVTSVTTLCTLGLSPLLFPLVGVVVEAWGARAFFALCAVVCGAAAGVAARDLAPAPAPPPKPPAPRKAAAEDAPPTPARPRTPPRSPRR